MATQSPSQEYGWVVSLDHEFPRKPKIFVPGIMTSIRLLGLAWRMYRLGRKKKAEGLLPFMDPMSFPKLVQTYGVPLGGIGGGTICRGFRGEFNRWQLQPGIYTHDSIAADQFILRVEEAEKDIFQTVLAVEWPTTKGRQLSAWTCSMNASKCTYRGLYPLAWTVYDLTEECGVVLICKQISPVIPHDYETSSTPAGVFEWTIENKTGGSKKVTIAFTFQNGTEETETDKVEKQGGHANTFFEGAGGDGEVRGVVLHHTHSTNPYNLVISARQTVDTAVTRHGRFLANSSGEDLWEDLRRNGAFCDKEDKTPSDPKEPIAAAVAACVTVEGNSSKTVDFCLAWSMPCIRFPGDPDGAAHYRRYTRFHGRDMDASSVSVAMSAHQHYRDWDARISAWQGEVLDDDALPAWYKSALFNELYVLIDGGTLWLDTDPMFTPQDAVSKVFEDIGHFAYLESHSYRMYNTLDVHFYASFALVMLWPRLQESLLEHFASTLMLEDKEEVVCLMNGHVAQRKQPGCLPHDIGDPHGLPWEKVNVYCIHDTSDWKDLNVKFVIQVYRDFSVTKDVAYLTRLYPICKRAMEKPISQDTNGDGLIENSGFADQTYDAWTVDGASAYCGGLFLAALGVMAEMARVVGDEEGRSFYSDMQTRGSEAYTQLLWDESGAYFHYDSSSSEQHRSIQADQLLGHMYLRASGLPSYLSQAQARSTLQTIYKHNVLGFEGGRMGAVNGVSPATGREDRTSMMSEEVWTGVTYALAATMIHEGFIEEGFRTAEGIYNTVYNELGLAYQTPEAFVKSGDYRSLGYMRPLSIWSIHLAWQQHKQKRKTSIV